MKLHNSTYRLVLRPGYPLWSDARRLDFSGIYQCNAIVHTRHRWHADLGLKDGPSAGRVFWAGEFFEHARRIAYATFLIGGNAVFRQWLSRSADVLCAPAGGSSGGVGRV